MRFALGTVLLLVTALDSSVILHSVENRQNYYIDARIAPSVCHNSDSITDSNMCGGNITVSNIVSPCMHHGNADA